MGSTCKTKSGAVAWLKKHPLKSRRLPLDMVGNHKRSFYQPKNITDRNVRRCKADKKFKATYLRKLRREVSKLIKPLHNDASMLEISNYEENREILTSSLNELASEISSITNNPNYCPIIPKTNGIVIPISETDNIYLHEIIRKSGFLLDLKCKDAKIIPTKRFSRLVSSPGITSWKRGKPVDYVRAVRENYVRLFAVIRSDSTLECALHSTTKTITLPDDYGWKIDKFGLKVVLNSNPSDDYHVSAEDLFGIVSSSDLFYNASDPIDTIIYKLHSNIKIRLKLKSDIANIVGESSGVHISMKDSLSAGNCKIGTLQFIKDHMLNKNAHHPIDTILKCNYSISDWARLKLAIKHACIRHSQEMKRGFSLISDHVIN